MLTNYALRGGFGTSEYPHGFFVFDSVDSPIAPVTSKLYFIQHQLAPEWIGKSGDRALLQSMMERDAQNGSAHDFAKAEAAADEVIAMLGAKDTPTPNVSE